LANLILIFGFLKYSTETKNYYIKLFGLIICAAIILGQILPKIIYNHILIVTIGICRY
jgi:hypothetical protein